MALGGRRSRLEVFGGSAHHEELTLVAGDDAFLAEAHLLGNLPRAFVPREDQESKARRRELIDPEPKDLGDERRPESLTDEIGSQPVADVEGSRLASENQQLKVKNLNVATGASKIEASVDRLEQQAHHIQELLDAE